MAGLSNIVIFGYLGRDAELKTVGSQSLCSFSVAVTKKRKGEDSTAWYACQLWGTRGEKLADYLVKGTAVIVAGELVPREYKGKSDELRTSLDINVSEFSFGGGGEKKKEEPAASPSRADYSNEEPF